MLHIVKSKEVHDKTGTTKPFSHTFGVGYMNLFLSDKIGGKAYIFPKYLLWFVRP